MLSVKNGIFSFKKLLAVSVAFALIGVTVASVAATTIMTIEAEHAVNQQPIEPQANILVWTDQETYAPGATVTIGLANPLNATVNFADDTYGLRLEQLVDGKWLKVLPIYDPSSSQTSSIVSITEARGNGEVTVAYQLASGIAAGFYRVVSEGQAMINGSAVYVEGTAEFNIA